MSIHYKPNLSFIGPVTEEPKKRECGLWHNWKDYVGFYEVYKFCEDCGVKLFPNEYGYDKFPTRSEK